MAREEQTRTFLDTDLHKLDLLARALTKIIELHVPPHMARADWLARVIAPDVLKIIDGAAAIAREARPAHIGELVSGERILMRRAIGILTDLQKLEREVGAVLDQFGRATGHDPVTELVLRAAIATRNGQNAEAAILHTAAQRLAGELETLRNGMRETAENDDDDGTPDSPSKIKP
jgi:hypothetical protein